MQVFRLHILAGYQIKNYKVCFLKKNLRGHFLRAIFSIEWQLISSTSVAALIIFCNLENVLLKSFTTNNSNLLVCLTMLGSILTLLTTLSVSFLVGKAESNSTQRYETLFQLKSRIYELESFLNAQPQETELTKECFKLTSNLKSKQLDEFPFDNWTDLVADIVSLTPLRELSGKSTQSLEHQVLSCLVMFEELMTNLSLLFVHRVILDMHSKRVIKGFFFLAGLLIISLIIFYSKSIILINILYFSPVFFGVLTLFHIAEIGWVLYQESQEDPRVV